MDPLTCSFLPSSFLVVRDPPLSILHVDFTLRLIIKSIWPPPSLGSALSARRRGRRDPLQEQEEGRGQPRGEFLLFIASILGAARERERLKTATTTASNSEGRSERRNGPPINLQNKTFYEAPLPVFLLPWLWPDRQPPPSTLPSPARWKKDREGHKRGRKRDRGFIAAKTNAISYTLPSTCLIDT